MTFSRIFAFVVLFTIAVLFSDCNRKPARIADVRRERSAQSYDFDGIWGEQVSFYSEALQRRMRYLVLLPASYRSNDPRRYPVIYLLHGGGGGGRPEEWTQQSSLLQNLRGRQWITILPQADLSWYVNAALSPQDRYEDYIVQDLRFEVDSHYRSRSDRGGRGIAGISMGGYGAAYLTLNHPEIYSFAGLFGASLDAPRRSFNLIHVGQGLHERNVFGPLGPGRDRYDPLAILSEYHDQGELFIWSMCGDRDSFLRLNLRFDRALDLAHIKRSFVTVRGAHDWPTWNSQLANMLDAWATHSSK